MRNKVLLSIISIIILLIIFPLLKPGYIFSLDQVLNPNGWVPNIGSHIYWVGLLSQLFSFLHVPIWILEKIIIISAFILPAVGGYFLSQKTKNTYAILFTSLFLVFNPFLYDRFLDGQINIYLSYALFPVFLYLLKGTLENFSIKKVIYLGILSLFLSLTSIHNIIFLFFIFIVFSLFYLKKTGYKNISKIGISILIFNLLWILPFLFLKIEKSGLTKQIGGFGIEHRQAFKTVSGDTNIYFNTLSMHGYWGESEKRFITTSQINEKWKNLFIVILLLVLIGILSKINFKNKKIKLNNFEKSLLLLAFISYILALGVSENNIFSGINRFLYDYLPFYKGFREPQKWVIFIVITYAYFGGIGIKFLYKKLQDFPIAEFMKKAILICLVFTPVFYNSQILFGFSGQVSIQKYPEEWKKIKNIMYKENTDFHNKCQFLEEKKSQSCYNTLSFPWHSYIGIQFTGKNVGGWIVRYFGNNILISDNIEIRNIYTQSNRSESKIIEKYIGPGGSFKKLENIETVDLEKFVQDIQGLGIKNILLLKEADYKWYRDFLDILVEKKYLKVEKENNMVTLYKIFSD